MKILMRLLVLSLAVVALVMRDVTVTVDAKTNGRQTPQRLTQLKHGLTLVPVRANAVWPMPPSDLEGLGAGSC